METDKIIEKRLKISSDYCKKKGWDIDNLSLEQLMEIRRLPEWKNVVNPSKSL